MTLHAIALAALADHVPDSGNPELRYLRDAAIADWVAELGMARENPCPADQALVELARTLGLTSLEVLVTAIVLGVEHDALMGRAVAFLQAPVGGSRPNLGLLAKAGAAISPTALSDLMSGVAVRAGVLQLLQEGHPLVERPVAAPWPLVLALRGVNSAIPGVTVGRGAAPEVPLPKSLRREAALRAAVLSSVPGQVLAIRTNSPSEGRAVAAEVARGLKRRPAFIEAERVEGLGPWLMVERLTPVFCLDLAPGERKLLPAIPEYDAPVLAVCGPEGSIEAAAGTAVSWRIAPPPSAEREQLWRAALGDSPLVSGLARHHRHSAGRIAHLGRLARHFSALRTARKPALEDIVQAAWTGESSDLETLAQPLRDPISDEAFVISEPVLHELKLLLARCEARDGLADGLGASTRARYRPGVRALFVGPSGTGKTLAAGWLATQLGLPLYRVDLAAITSKYIGETEKNLGQLMSRAEQAECVLLFDEADSLFGKRTDIRDSNDRFANQQTNYLLQRIEAFDGIALLTSNSRARFDAAFSRRLDAILEFPMPSPDERRRLWLSHLGEASGLAPRELNQIAATADLAGGHIRNVVLLAAVLAGKESRKIQAADVREGLEIEYRKLGRQMPAELRGG